MSAAIAKIVESFMIFGGSGEAHGVGVQIAILF